MSNLVEEIKEIKESMDARVVRNSNEYKPTEAQKEVDVKKKVINSKFNETRNCLWSAGDFIGYNSQTEFNEKYALEYLSKADKELKSIEKLTKEF